MIRRTLAAARRLLAAHRAAEGDELADVVWAKGDLALCIRPLERDWIKAHDGSRLDHGPVLGDVLRVVGVEQDRGRTFLAFVRWRDEVFTARGFHKLQPPEAGARAAHVVASSPIRLPAPAAPELEPAR